jgi:hypothetical protein
VETHSPALLDLPAALAAIGEGEVFIAGGGAPLLAEALGARARIGPALPDAGVIARLAAASPAPDGPPSPLYLRPPDIRPPKRALDRNAPAPA